MGVTSCFFPVNSLIAVQLKKPQMIPCVMEKVSGINRILRKAGMASSYFVQLILRIGVIMKIPTMIRMGDVAIAGTMDSNGEKNMKGKKSNPATTAVNPVLPPAAIPVADSI